MFCTFEGWGEACAIYSLYICSFIWLLQYKYPGITARENLSAVLNPNVLFDKGKASALVDEFLTAKCHFGKF